MKEHGAHRLAALSMLTGAALMLSYLETLIPLTPGLPGIKLGLANLAALLCLYLFGLREALAVNGVRVCLAALLFGGLHTLIYSLAGAAAALAVMTLCRRTGRFSEIGVSAAGGVFHNIAQLAVAAAVVQTPQVFYYLPWLLISGCLTGVFLGAATKALLRHLKSIFDRRKE